MIRTAKIKYEQRLISDMIENPNLYQGHCRRSLKTNQGVTNVEDGTGQLTETEEEAAAALNEYYHSEFPRQTEVSVSEEAVEEVLMDLNPNKAAGPDGVESRLLKESAKETAPILCQWFRKSMYDGEVPSQWKEAHIIPIHKKARR